MKPRISLIVAMANNLVIGAGNALPWHLPADLKHFKTLTMGHHIIMGRKTYESIGKPLPGRTSVVVTRNTGFFAPGAIVVNSLEAAIVVCGDDAEIFVIGGAELYRQAITLVDRIYLTEIEADMPGDAHFTDFDRSDGWRETCLESHAADEKNPYAYRFMIYDRMR